MDTIWLHHQVKERVRCMQMAMATAKNKIDYINTHGTSTPVGDITELNAVKKVFGNEYSKN